MEYEYLFAVGQDSHRFIHTSDNTKNRRHIDASDNRATGAETQTGQRVGGVWIDESPTLLANSDGDVLLHALTNAISGITGVNILGEKADRMCLQQGITDSSAYLREAVKYLGDRKIIHVSFSVECKTPRLAAHIDDIRLGVSNLLSIPIASVCLTVTSGEELTSFGRGEGITVICGITVRQAQRET